MSSTGAIFSYSVQYFFGSPSHLLSLIHFLVTLKTIQHFLSDRLHPLFSGCLFLQRLFLFRVLND